MAKTLTTANSSLTVQVRGLFPAPVSIQGYATDDSFAVDDVTPSERYMGVDGKFSAGYVPYPTKLTLMLQADSDSMQVFDDTLAAQVAAKELYVFDAVLIIQGTGEKCIFTKGYMAEISPAPTAKKVLQPRRFAIEFESYSKAPT